MRRLAYALLAACWIAGLALWLRPRAAPEPVPLAHGFESQAPVVSQPAVAHAPRKLAPSAAPRKRVSGDPEAQPLALVRVRSSVGLPLLSVEVSVAGEEWTRVELPQSGLEVEHAAYPLRVRAAGHRETEAVRGAQEVVLEPDALLTVESANLRTRARRLETLEHSGFSTARAWILAEFPDADHLQVAFSPERIAPIHSGDVEVRFACPDGRPVAIDLHPLSGLRAQYVLPPDDLRGTAPLEVEIVDEGERPGWIRLWLTELGPVRASTAREEFAWGSVTIGEPVPPDFPEPLWGRASRARVEALGLGHTYALCALDENEHYGRIEFAHDGSERRIVLQLPYMIVGRAVDAASSQGLVWPDVRGYPLGEPEEPDWFGRAGPSDELGGFEVHVPGSRWGKQAGLAPLEPPERFTIVVSAEGHRSQELELEWSGRRRVDLGAIALERNLRPIVIDRDDGLLAPWTDLHAFTFGDDPALEWTLRHVVARADGDQELELAFSGDEARVMCRNLVSGEITARPFAAQNGELLLLSAHGEALAFRRGEGGTYRQLQRQLHEIEVQCQKLPESGVWTLGWRGGGTWAGFRMVNRAGAVATGLALPEIATELWWSEGEAPPDLCRRAGASLRLDASEKTLVLR